MAPSSQQDDCAICLGPMGRDRGQAIFTAECGHAFHFQCISSNVAYGNVVCPLCNAQWKELPFVSPAPTPVRHQFPVSTSVPFFPATEPRVFNDDEAIDLPGACSGLSRQSGGLVELETRTEFPSVAKSSFHEDFAVLIHLRAPSAGPTSELRTPLDLVTVLDVSGSMAGVKLTLLKQAMAFVIQNLGPADRLSIVSFSSSARRLFKLTRMNGPGSALAMRAVESLSVGGGTNIAEGLRKAAKLVEERRYRNTVSAIMLLSDGQDTYTMGDERPGHRSRGGHQRGYDALMPRFDDRSSAPPIHTFGFGADHDAAAMHHIAEATAGGTFSFIEDQGSIQDAFALCIGGLLTVIAQNVTVDIAATRARLTNIKSGSYENRVAADRRSASINVGDLYADEERRFLVFIDVPPALTGETSTLLMDVKCKYQDTATRSAVEVSGGEVIVRRPLRAVNLGPSAEVEREKTRAQAAEDMAAAQQAAERGAHREAAEILESRLSAVAESTVATAGDSTMAELQNELREMQLRVSSRRRYEADGRAYMLAGMSSYSLQRASTRPSTLSDFNEPTQPGEPSEVSGPSQYQTPAMARMLRNSRSSREVFPRDALPR